VTARTHDDRTPLDLATADDVKTLLGELDPTVAKTSHTITRVRSDNRLDKPASSLSSSSSSSSSRIKESRLSIAGSDNLSFSLKSSQSTETTASSSQLTTIEVNGFKSQRSNEESAADGCMDLDESEGDDVCFDSSVREFLRSVDETYVEAYAALFEQEQLTTVDVLAEVASHDQLKEIGVSAYGARHRILKAVEKYLNESNGEAIILFF
jgi:tankyrase